MGLNYSLLPGKYLYKKRPTLQISIFRLTSALSIRSLFGEDNFIVDICSLASPQMSFTYWK